MTTVDYEHNMVLATTKYDVVGTRPIRHDGADKVTGRALYGADFQAAGLLHRVGGAGFLVWANPRVPLGFPKHGLLHPAKELLLNRD